MDRDVLLGRFVRRVGHGLLDFGCGHPVGEGVQGVTCEHEPTSFAGYKIERSAERDVATISMPELIEQKLKQECPELVSVAARAAFKLEHVKGGKLHAP